MSTYASGQLRMPPGFRFHPTDEELVGYYLKKKVASEQLDMDIIHEVDLYKLEPWDLQEQCKSSLGEQTEWYFYSHRDKKYLTGTRANRATIAGFWKATGRDKAIYNHLQLIGRRKTLVFYRGRAPNGQKTNWIMHEYRLEEPNNSTGRDIVWVICHVFKKRMDHKDPDQDHVSVYKMQDHMLSNLDSSNSTKAAACGGPFLCKKETELEHTSLRCTELPHLESPEFFCNVSSSEINGSNGGSTRNLKSTPPITHEAKACAKKPRPATLLQGQPQVFGTDLEPGWDITNAVAVKGLGQQTTLKDQNYDMDKGNNLRDGALLQQSEFPSSYEIDLWNFEK
ncbi:hypothetical protein O6H91_04G019600 [Diphasiastrum complanatum]|uniref:Uncharacterized protein n=2 Tax=Diphasiastrum complanatum TaxID=34168 RepID=A0ACC2DUS1_DIPCM|nr:hypothetical protein O6H91_04G019600 [Diphasiastrum complanatum]KAJ7557983.1 hypothetical protein O6H91_04G019600 [Diphasiastrum complanatum]